jgi:hypothetical protein
MDILMPQLGETVTEGKITTWFKSIGDAVRAGDNLFEIETDKVSMEVPATAAGVLAEIRVGSGEVAPVGAGSAPWSRSWPAHFLILSRLLAGRSHLNTPPWWRLRRCHPHRAR